MLLENLSSCYKIQVFVVRFWTDQIRCDYYMAGRHTILPKNEGHVSDYCLILHTISFQSLN